MGIAVEGGEVGDHGIKDAGVCGGGGLGIEVDGTGSMFEDGRFIHQCYRLENLCGEVRGEGERMGSRFMVTSVALRGFVGVANVRCERRGLRERHVCRGLVDCTRRPAVLLGRVLAIILSKAGDPSSKSKTTF